MEVTRFFDILDKLKSEQPRKSDILNTKENGSWRHYSVEEFYNYSNWFSMGLMKLGFEKGDKIATVSQNRPEWNFIDMGMSQLGVIHTPIYPTISDDDYTHILSHSEAKIIVVSDSDLYKRISKIASKISNKPEIYTFDRIEGAKNWMEIVELGKEAANSYMRGKLTNIKNTISKDDVATIIYTSGTTGLSKGVMLTHWNFMYQAKEIERNVNLGKQHKNFSFLPLCHVLERIGNYTFMYLGLSIYYAESMDTISDNLKEVKPHVFVTVPRLLERIYDKIVQKGNELTGVKKNLFFWALDLALKYELNGANGPLYELNLAIANKLIFSKWREALGGNIEFIISGGAALQPRLARVFWAAKIPLLEGYGLTETAPVISVNFPGHDDTMFGTTGKILGKEQKVKIAEDGEILFKGPNLMPGYYKAEEKTKEVIDKDGWFHTGDIGELVNDEFLKITDRK
ncbi:MAG: AMP-binding protein, partial [Bacteroidales bacterium]|nr:AMP-binding protein [Bacteroidales bacterium]